MTRANNGGTTGTQETQPLAERVSNRSHRPRSKAFRDFITSGWCERDEPAPTQLPVAPFAARRRAVIGRMFPDDRLVIPAGGLKTRSNDTDYRFRPHSAFAHLTGLGTDREPDAVLVLNPRRPQDPGAGTHQAVLYFRPRAGRDTEEFYADSRYGELWVGARPTLEQVTAELGIRGRHIDDLAEEIATDAGPQGVRLRVVPGVDKAVEDLVTQARQGQQAGQNARSGEHVPAQSSDAMDTDGDAQLAQALSELRLVKDAWEIEQMRLAVQLTVEGFADVARNLPEAAAHPRGERVIETTFESHARRFGNGVGYDTIAAAGAHACTLHWIRNDGPVRAEDLVLIDAGAEVDSLYTADLTRTLPVSGTYSDAQRKVYELVLAAADAAFEQVVPGAKFRDVHDAAMRVLAHGLADWGLLPVDAESALDEQSGSQHRRW
ncbi:MAG: Xaa-Pro aminopeptidase, partial [Micrococcales bacterium]